MLDLWLEASRFAAEQGISLVLPKMVSPSQLYGIEIEFYAHELASVVVWIGFLQWKHEHGVLEDREPVLQKLDNIQHADAILRYRPVDPVIPSANAVIPSAAEGSASSLAHHAPGAPSFAPQQLSPPPTNSGAQRVGDAPEAHPPLSGTSKAPPVSSRLTPSLPAVILSAAESSASRPHPHAAPPKPKPYEPEWPPADFIIGNPPFLGGKFLRRELGDTRVNDLFRVYAGRVPAEADLVTYWFEKARALVEARKVKRVGLLATQGIRGGANRLVLQRIQNSGSIFWAHSDRPWVLDGASVRISMIAFDGGEDSSRTLNGEAVGSIHPNLSSDTNVGTAVVLRENAGICFMGTTKVGPFDLSREEADRMLRAPLNPNGRPNSDVVKPWVNALDITRRSRGMYIIDFGTSMTEAEAALYEWPFEYVRTHVKPDREKNRREGKGASLVAAWRNYPCYATCSAKQESFYRHATRSEASHIHVDYPRRYSRFTGPTLLPVSDDYFFGLLNSRIHEVWTLKNTSWHGVGHVSNICSRNLFPDLPLPLASGQRAAG